MAGTETVVVRDVRAARGGRVPRRGDGLQRGGGHPRAAAEAAGRARGRVGRSDRPAAAREVRRGQADDVGDRRRRRADRHADVARARRASPRAAPTWRGGGGSWSPPPSPSARGLAMSAAGTAWLAAVCFAAAAVAGGIFPARRAVAAIRSRTLDINTLMVVAVVGAAAARRMARSGDGGVPLRGGAVAGGADPGARPAGDSRADRSVAPRGDWSKQGGVERQVAGRRHPGRRRDPRAAGRQGAARWRDRVGPQRRQRSAADRRIAAGGQRTRATRSSPGRSTAMARSTCASRASVRDTRLARIIHLVETAQASRAPVQSFVDRFARIYTPAVLALAIVVASSRPWWARLTRPSGSTARWCCW